MVDVFIPDDPERRTYACPGCHKGVLAIRVGHGSQYVIRDADDKQDHGCGYKGPIPIELLGYRRVKLPAPPPPEGRP